MPSSASSTTAPACAEPCDPPRQQMVCLWLLDALASCLQLQPRRNLSTEPCNHVAVVACISSHGKACVSIVLLQHSSGYEAALDPWLQQLWIALRLKCPLPPGVQQVSPTGTLPKYVTDHGYLALYACAVVRAVSLVASACFAVFDAPSCACDLTISPTPFRKRLFSLKVAPCLLLLVYLQFSRQWTKRLCCG